MIPNSELIDMTRPFRTPSLVNITAVPSRSNARYNDDTTYKPLDYYGKESVGHDLGAQLDGRVWEVIQKEVMDWYEPDTMNILGRLKKVGYDILRF